MNRKIQIIGVPEHFNLPWHLAMDEGAFQQRGINLEWSDVPEGTGKMVELLNSGKSDLAILLTEGFVRAVSEGLQAVIAQEYIASPLLWGVHVHAQSPYTTQAELAYKKAAISRYGSGSHLMAFVHGKNMAWPEDALQFEVINTLEGAVEALTDQRADYFMWEKFTTQPLVDQGVFRRVGVCPTPWPCFVIVARADFARDEPGLLSDLLETINGYTAEFKQIPSIDRTLANHYKQTLADIREWLSLTRWSQSQLKTETLVSVIDTLNELNLLKNKVPAQHMLWNPKVL
ncbi:substrate-binding domain-containing protein [Robiginitalea sp.]|jgi:ABC-type nitrate/sulfonate/bicarbonate transport system substrate-binding protein|uniref:substrate-binding domain-containing protein n=1 Tax=Robiginitalea sp. TaxID=1902411 RepID=UPI003C723121